MSELADVLGVGPQLEFRGKVYQFTALDLADIARLETWLERMAWEGLERNAKHVPDWLYRDAVRQVTQDTAAQQYSFGTETFQKAMSTIAGVKQKALLSLRHEHPEADDELVDEMFKEVPQQVARTLAAVK